MTSVSTATEDGQAVSNVIPLTQFVDDFGDGLLKAVAAAYPPIYDGVPDPFREAVMDGLARNPFPAQRDLVQAVSQLLIDQKEPAAVINAEMGTGKTMMAIATAMVMYAEGARRFLVVAPPHLVYKWRREIKQTIKGARVWVLNGPDTLRKLLALRDSLDEVQDEAPEFFVLGRVRMRMDYHWRTAVAPRRVYVRPEGDASLQVTTVATCPDCGAIIHDSDGTSVPFAHFSNDKRVKCESCGGALWTLMRKGGTVHKRDSVRNALLQFPTVGPKAAEQLLKDFGEATLEDILSDNIYEFINLMNEDGELVFSDRQAIRMERQLGTIELQLGQGGYQATEFIKRQLPRDVFDLLILDESHELRSADSAQGQAMGVLANKVRRTLALTGTLMGGYADDLFFLLWRIMPRHFLADGYQPTADGRMGPAAMAFMREHGVLKEVYKETHGESHRTARGKRVSVRTSKAPGFGPKGVARYILPFTVFLKLRDIGADVLPPYNERYTEIAMSEEQASRYDELALGLEQELQQALARGDTTLLGVVLNVLLAWPDTAFRQEVVKHPRTRALLAYVPSIFGDAEPSPKEAALLDLMKAEKARGRKVLVYTIYTGVRDTAGRLKALMEAAGLKAAVLRASVATGKREQWIADQVDKGIDGLVTNPELVKTGLDLLDFPTIVFLQTGWDVYTLLQAARRSWRIGQLQGVEVVFLGYQATAQMTCLELMAKKIVVAQSTSGDMPETGLEALNQDGDSMEVAMAKRLAA